MCEIPKASIGSCVFSHLIINFTFWHFTWRYSVIACIVWRAEPAGPRQHRKSEQVAVPPHTSARVVAIAGELVRTNANAVVLPVAAAASV